MQDRLINNYFLSVREDGSKVLPRQGYHVEKRREVTRTEASKVSEFHGKRGEEFLGQCKQGKCSVLPSSSFYPKLYFICKILVGRLQTNYKIRRETQEGFRPASKFYSRPNGKIFFMVG